MDTKTPQLTIPTPEEIERQIAVRKEEIRALTKLLRMAKSAEYVEKARKRTQALSHSGSE